MSMTEETKTKIESEAGESSDVENGNCSSSGSGGDTKKTCVDCGTSRTPLWRSGPAGPKSLCNACGIKSRKKRQAALGIRHEDTRIKNKTSNNDSPALDNRTMNKIARAELASVKMTKADSGHIKNKIKMKTDPESKKNMKRSGSSRFLDLGFKVPAMKRSDTKSVWRKMGEEERAAVLLMALSCG